MEGKVEHGAESKSAVTHFLVFIFDETFPRGTFPTDHLMGSGSSSSTNHNPLDKDVSEVILFGLEPSFLEGMEVLTVNHNC